jgi:hypothetical protein
VPTLIGDVGLNTRSMFTNRSGRPRSLIRAANETVTAALAHSRARVARRGRADASAAAARIEDAPARPPQNRYPAISSSSHTGGLMIGCP